ncbi:MAG TPA: PHB depolymerase family esterase [Polyangiaceae bacterium]|jgi:poly(hydroxyalkanoate) depolymerase family esterase
MSRHRNFVGSLSIIGCSIFVPALAHAAGLTGPVSGWSSGVPSYISMYEYVPAKLAASPPVVVAAHYCGGSASAMFNFTGMPAIEQAADKYGFVMIFPQTTNPASSMDCWDVGSKASLTHNGGGDTQAIAEMVSYEISKRNADPGRVYIMGASSGAMLTEAMLAVYPDVFKAGAEFSGVPAGCWSDGWSASSNWGGVCANGKDIQSAQQWGQLVSGMYPGYTGHRPRVQLWHGTADMTILYPNMGEAIKEWTNVLGLNTTPDTNTTSGAYQTETWKNSCGFTVLEAHTQNGGGHTTPIDSNSVLSFFGLDKTGQDPEIAMCGGGSAGSGGAGNTGGSGSTTGGASSGGGSGNSGGSFGTAGTTGTAGGFGGSFGVGGASSGGSANTTGGNSTIGSGGTIASGPTSTGGTNIGVPGSAGSSDVTGSSATNGNGDDSGDQSSGCSLGVASNPGSTGALGGFVLAAIGAALGRRRRRR